jgi:DNA polymerase III subunit beta
MDLFLDRGLLARSLASIQTVVERRATIPAHSHVLLHASPAGLRLTATDSEVAYIAELGANVETSGDVAVDAASLFAVVRSLDHDTVRLKVGTGSRLEIRSGQSFFRLPGLEADGFPLLPAFDARGRALIASSQLKRAIDQVVFAIATEDQRYGLNGAHLEEAGAGRLRLVATDGHRLSVAEASFEGDLAVPPRQLFPRKALTVLSKVLDGSNEPVALSFGDNAVQVSRPEQRLWFRLLDGEFPDYKAVLPTSSRHVVTCGREALGSALRRVAILAQDRHRPVKFGFAEDELTMESRSADRGEVTERIPVELEGGAIDVGFNVRYIQDILGVMSADHVRVELSEALGPARVSGVDDTDAFFVVMPMRLS